jgi:hypothetical protein
MSWNAGPILCRNAFCRRVAAEVTERLRLPKSARAKGTTWVGLEIIGKVATELDVERAELLRVPPRRLRCR